MRYLATIGYCLVAFLSIFLANKASNPYLAHVIWGIVLYIQPYIWFHLAANPEQWRKAETYVFVVTGLVGLTCHAILSAADILSYPVSGGTILFYLFAFWGSAGIAVLKLGCTIISKFKPGVFQKAYQDRLDAQVGDCRFMVMCWVVGVLPMLLYAFLV